MSAKDILTTPSIINEEPDCRGNGDTGFVFYQLGTLQYCNSLEDPTTTDTDLAPSKWWGDTEFVLVAKIGANGRSEDI